MLSSWIPVFYNSQICIVYQVVMKILSHFNPHPDPDQRVIHSCLNHTQVIDHQTHILEFSWQNTRQQKADRRTRCPSWAEWSGPCSVRSCIYETGCSESPKPWTKTLFLLLTRNKQHLFFLAAINSGTFSWKCFTMNTSEMIFSERQQTTGHRC